RRARERSPQPALPRPLAARRGGPGAARERGGRLPARRLRGHRQFPLQPGVQDRLPGVVPARDRRGRRDLLERALALTPDARRLATRARSAPRARARVSDRRLVLPLESLREQPDARWDEVARTTFPGRRSRDRLATEL